MVGVANHERDVVDSLAKHVVDSVAATTAHANHFDDVGTLWEIKWHNVFV
jgi:hypothetical protein